MLPKTICRSNRLVLVNSPYSTSELALIMELLIRTTVSCTSRQSQAVKKKSSTRLQLTILSRSLAVFTIMCVHMIAQVTLSFRERIQSSNSCVKPLCRDSLVFTSLNFQRAPSLERIHPRSSLRKDASILSSL